MRRVMSALGSTFVVLHIPLPCAWGDYTIKRLATGFHLPVYATTAPGDDDRIFIVTLGGLSSHETDADPITSVDGKIWIYKRSTGEVNSIPFLHIEDTDETDVVPSEPEVGLWGMAFHPDFQNNGKFYVNVAVENTPTNSVFAITLREYTVSANPDLSDTLPSRTVFSLDKDAGAEANHNGTWIGFNPIANAANDDKHYLYVTYGDGGGQNDSNNDAQNLNNYWGKTIRIDVDGPDAYPADASRNYAIPASNPFFGATAGADEIWNYGLRNPWQAHFDRQTGDLWIGDVGQGTMEEVNFQPASSTGGENYQWRFMEGTINGPGGGNPPVGSVPPAYAYYHNTGQGGTAGFTGLSVSGGVVYRGPVAELQGKYIFADSRSGEVWGFDPADPYGTVERMKLLPDFQPNAGEIDYVVSFSEDNQGNLLIVDYDGEIFQVFRKVDLTLTVNRETGELLWSNSDGSPTAIRSYRIASKQGAINPDSFVPITGNYDATGTGDIDANDAWQITSNVDSNTLFAEKSQGDGGEFEAMSMFTAGNAGVWIQSIYEDLDIEAVLADGSLVVADVIYTGNGGVPFERSDLNFNGALDAEDWEIFKDHHHNVVGGLSVAESYQFGDFDGDGDNDFADYRLFQADYIAANGAEAFGELLGNVPEPSSILMALIGLAGISRIRIQRRRLNLRSEA